jgi:hypothetical protein
MSDHIDVQSSGLYGLMAEFDSPDALVAAARRTRELGYRTFDAYTPFPIEELHEAMDAHRTAVPLLVLIGGIAGGLLGYGLEYWVSAVAYPLNIGGRPLHSWPAFIPIAFETTVLFAALTAVFGMLALNRLPKPYHPVFNAPRFVLATRDRFFLCIESADAKFDTAATRQFLLSLGPREVTDVEP